MARLTLILGVLATVVYLLDGFRFMLNEWRTWRKKWNGMNKEKWILIVIGVLLMPSIAEAACLGTSPTRTAVSSGRTDVEDCITAAVDGDTVHVPSGSSTWASRINITKSISLAGAGIDQTVITGDSTTASCIIGWQTKSTGNSPAGFAEITGFTFETTGTCGTGGADTESMIAFAGDSANIRVHHNKFNASVSGALHIFGYARGVADHNEFVNSSSLRHLTPVEHEGWASVGAYGDNSWATASTIGTAEAFFFEDNIYTNTHATIGYYCTNDTAGSRVVYRFNTWTNCTTQTHGLESGGRTRSGRQIEIYRNLFLWNEEAAFGGLINSRGGTAHIFDNDVTTSGIGSITTLIRMHTYRAGPIPHPGSSYYPFGYCGQLAFTVTRSGTVATGTTAQEHGVWSSNSYINVFGASDSNFNGTGIVADRVSSSQFTYTVANTGATSDSATMEGTPDGNADATGYPCMDQIGRGAGGLISGDGPGGSPVSPLTPINQGLEPFLMFYNHVDAVLKDGAAGNGADVILTDRDYFNQDASCAGASCTTGIGRGTSLPTGCTPVGTNPDGNPGKGPYYWKTDAGSWNTSVTETYSDTPGEDGALYRCTATNTWTLEYTPYIYPHPLVTEEDESGQTQPAVIVRIIRWMSWAGAVSSAAWVGTLECLSVLLGLGFHFRKPLTQLAFSVAHVGQTVLYSTPSLLSRNKQGWRVVALKTLTAFNHYTKPKD